MGPTTFLLGTRKYKVNAVFNDILQRDELLSKATCRLSTLQKKVVVLGADKINLAITHPIN
jgi:hypothetical protein